MGDKNSPLWYVLWNIEIILNTKTLSTHNIYSGIQEYKTSNSVSQNFRLRLVSYSKLINTIYKISGDLFKGKANKKNMVP